MTGLTDAVTRDVRSLQDLGGFAEIDQHRLLLRRGIEILQTGE